MKKLILLFAVILAPSLGLAAAATDTPTKTPTSTRTPVPRVSPNPDPQGLLQDSTFRYFVGPLGTALVPTRTFTPTKTPTVNASWTPAAGNQYTATPTKTITTGVFIIPSDTPTITQTPTGTLVATVTSTPTIVLGVVVHETPITGVYTIPTPVSTAAPITFFVAPANSYIFEMSLVAGTVTISGTNVITRANALGTFTYPATIAPGILEDFNKNPWCFSAATTFSVLESTGGGTISYSGFKH